MLRTMSKQVLYISKVGICSASLDTLCQWSVTLTMFPDIQKELSAFQSVLSASGPITGHHCKGPGSIFAHYLRVFMWMKSLLNVLSSRLNQSQYRLPSCICQLFQTLNHPCGTSLSCIQHVHVSLVLRNTGQDAALQVWFPSSLHSVTKYAFLGISCWIPLISYDESQGQNMPQEAFINWKGYHTLKQAA